MVHQPFKGRAWFRGTSWLVPPTSIDRRGAISMASVPTENPKRKRLVAAIDFEKQPAVL